MSERLQTTKGLYGFPLISGLVYRFTTFLVWLLMKFRWRGTLRGLDKLPKEEPFLLLPNHTSMLDPFWAGALVPRGVRSMASAGLLRIPVLGTYLRMCGCFPKMKYTKDRESMQNLQRFYDQGYVILLFPEGNRSWNGETQPIGEGIGRLIKRLGCKVVYARINTAYLVRPRWAKYSRRVPVEIDYDGPYAYDEDASVAEITADVQSKLTVVPPTELSAKVSGRKMAHGLNQYLWACPSCFEMESLKPQARERSKEGPQLQEVAGDGIACSACSASWVLDVYCMLHSNEEQPMSVADAFRKIEANFGSPPVADRSHHEASGEALVLEHAEVLLIPRKGKPQPVAAGKLVLKQSGIEVHSSDPSEAWGLSWAEMRGISVEVGNKLHFRQEDRLYRVQATGHSPLKLDHFFCHWSTASQKAGG